MSDQEKAWTRFAGEIGAEFIKGRELRLGPLRLKMGTDEVEAKVEYWTVRLDTYRTGGSEAQPRGFLYTRLRGSYSGKHPLRLEVYSEDLLGRLGRTLGMQDIEIGYPELDREFIIKGDDESRVRTLLSNLKIRQLISNQPDVNLRSEEGELCVEVPGVITEVARLKALYELSGETLRQLREIGAIY